MIPRMLTLVVIVSLFGPSKAAPQEDLITNLPGLPKQPDFKQYSGYLQGVTTRRQHYWYIESSSNPAEDPVVLWLSGGPFTSSMVGLFQEHGPFKVNADGKTLSLNPYSWNQVANMIYLETPDGTGYSYATDNNITTSDDQVVQSIYLALTNFFTKFPELKGNDLYLTGQGFAGKWLPILAGQIVDETDFNLKGFAVGNGWTRNVISVNSIFFFQYFHGFYGKDQWDGIVEACCPGNNTDTCNIMYYSNIDVACYNKAFNITMILELLTINQYNLLADCFNPTSGVQVIDGRNPTSTQNFDQQWPRKTSESANWARSPACMDFSDLYSYMNLPDVRDSLHIPKEAPKEWLSTNLPVGYIPVYHDMTPFYTKLLSSKLRILLYAGDMSVKQPFLGIEWFVDSLHPQKPGKKGLWYYTKSDKSKQVAGYAKAYDIITFATLKGAGYFSAMDKPLPALTLFTNFVQNRPF